MNEQPRTFIRGQVWYWEDPIYGSKEAHNQVAIGEVTMRYNRYCIVVQTTSLIDKSSVLVVPLSSCPNTNFDVPVELSFLFNDSHSYARVKNLFPVHPRYLTKYICTISDNKMKEIEAEIAKMLVPSIVDTLGKDSFKDMFGIDYDSDYHKPIREFENILETHVRMFIKKYLIKSDNENDVISSYELKNVYDQFCVMNNFSTDTDLIEFLDMFIKLTTSNTYSFISPPKFISVDFKGIRFRRTTEFSISLTENQDLINPDDPQKSSKWNDDMIKDFLNEYSNNGVDSASEKFGLKQSTATSYWYKWKDKLEELQSEEIQKVEELKTISRIPSTNDIDRSISKISNFIRDYLRNNDIYKQQRLEVRNGKEGCLIELSSAIDENVFYSKLNIAVYYSLIDLLSIKIKKGTIYVPKLYENSKYLDTWHFFDKAYHDRRISRNSNMIDTLDTYKKCFPDKKGIAIEWIGILKRSIASKISLSPKSIDYICREVSNLCLLNK